MPLAFSHYGKLSIDIDNGKVKQVKKKWDGLVTDYKQYAFIFACCQHLFIYWYDFTESAHRSITKNADAGS
jgi:hypothetical protein